MNAPLQLDGHDTPQKLFRARCRTWGPRPALRWKARGLWHTLAWAGYHDRAREAGLAFAALGARPGEVISVLAENQPEWVIADWGARGMGMIGNGLYPTASPEQVEYILADSESRVVVVENEEQLDKLLAVRARLPRLARIVVIEQKGLRGFSDPQVMSWEALMDLGARESATRAADWDAAIDAGRPEDVCFLVYTSGTTGQPKGAMISNRNMMFQILHTPELAALTANDRTLSFLPLCHIAERDLTCFTPLWAGHTVHFPESSATVFNDMREVQPHLVFAPPRFWEKMYSNVELFMRDAIAPARWTYARAIAGERPFAGHTARRLALAHVRKFLGLAEARHAITGAAPVAPELLSWFAALGVNLLEAYGMTESAGMISSTPADRPKIGWAGLPARGTEVRIGAEGEILVRGPHVFAGYWNQPEKTREAIDADGWLHTGDVGEIDADGYVGIRDRLKDIIITSGGKNVTPSAIENLLKFSPYISDAMVVGESRKYLTCLVMLDQDSVARFAQERQVPYTDFASLTRATEVIELIRGEVERANDRLARVEQVKDFRIISELLTAEDEELTPTMKLKRRVVARKYAALIETMYSDS